MFSDVWMMFHWIRFAGEFGGAISFHKMTISRYFNRSGRFINAYRQGLEGEDAIYAGKKFKGHRCIPASWVAKVKQGSS
jgi:hypothetical protein